MERVSKKTPGEILYCDLKRHYFDGDSFNKSKKTPGEILDCDGARCKGQKSSRLAPKNMVALSFLPFAICPLLGLRRSKMQKAKGKNLLVLPPKNMVALSFLPFAICPLLGLRRSKMQKAKGKEKNFVALFAQPAYISMGN